MAADALRGRLSDLGVVAGLLVQLVLTGLGIAVVALSWDGEPTGLITLWCLIATVYALVMVVSLSFSVRSDTADHRPSLIQASAGVRWVSLLASIISGVVGLLGSFLVIFGGDEPDQADFSKMVGVWAILLAWGMIHWGFAQFYYVHYYAGPQPTLAFPGGESPSLVDFVYFAFTVGTTFATSDVSLLTRAQRWRTTMHAVIAFFFNSAILVLAIGTITGA